jgi:cytochrome b6
MLWPQTLGAQGDPLAAAPPGIHPEWYFMNQFAALKLIGKVLPGMAGELAAMGSTGLAMLLWGLVPLFDPRGAGERRARSVTWFGLAVLGITVALTILGYFLA